MAKTSRTRERREAREKQRRRRRMQLAAVLVVIGVVAAVGLLILSTSPADAPLPEDVGEKYAGLPRGVSEDGFPRIGEPAAPVTLVEYSSFSCPACAVFHENVMPAIVERIRDGQANLTFVPLQTGGIPNASGAARAALCAGTGSSGLFWEMHDVLFDWHTRFGNTAFTSNRLASGVEALGINVDNFNTCFNSSATDNLLNRALQQGVTSTPTLTVNGTRVDTPMDVNAVLAAIDIAYAPFAERDVTPDEPEVIPTEEVIEEPVATAEPETTPEAEATTEPEAETTEEAAGS